MKNDMAQIPYIEHKHRLYLAHCREKCWKWLFIGSNILWLLGAILWVLLG